MALLVPGDYTVVVSGVNNTTGIGLVENYTLDTYRGLARREHFHPRPGGQPATTR